VNLLKIHFSEGTQVLSFRVFSYKKSGKSSIEEVFMESLLKEGTAMGSEEAVGREGLFTESKVFALIFRTF